MIEILLKALGFFVLTYASFQDVKDEMFSVLPVILALTPTVIRLETVSVLGLVLALSILPVYKKWIRFGDVFPILLYAAMFPSYQSIFTLILVTGLYIAMFKEVFPEKEWIPYLPAILTSYIIHLTCYLLTC